MPPKKQSAALAGPPKVEVPSIPLHCLLCPKRPTFSDVSHLLTHISSKSHLSKRFIAEIRSQKDRDARESLRQFDVWYQRYGIRDLLADRMAAKDKKGPKRGRARSPIPKPRDFDELDEMIKPEPDFTSLQNTNSSLHAHSARQDHGPNDSPYGTPSTRRSKRLRPANGVIERQLKSEPCAKGQESGESNFQDEDSASVIADEELGEKTKLKGVFWPGMNMFDSATEDQKRKRNQRKDGTVLRHIEQVAASVEPTECVWSEDIDLQRTRDIYATPSIFGSPEPEEEVRPKKKRARRSMTTAKIGKGRGKRASTRVTRANKVTQETDDEESSFNGDNRDATQEVTPTDDFEPEEKLVSSSSTASPDDAYEIFCDPLGAASGQFDAMLQHYYEPQLDPLLVSPALTWASSGHADGPLNGMKSEPGFEPAPRMPLQPMSSNIAMASPSANSCKHFGQLRRGHTDLAVPSHSPSPIPFYSQPQNLAYGNFNNPLANARARSGLSYTSHFSGTFDGDSKPIISGFQPINAMHGLPPFGPYALQNGNNYFASPSGQTDATNFEI